MVRCYWGDWHLMSYQFCANHTIGKETVGKTIELKIGFGRGCITSGDRSAYKRVIVQYKKRNAFKSTESVWPAKRNVLLRRLQLQCWTRPPSDLFLPFLSTRRLVISRYCSTSVPSAKEWIPCRYWMICKTYVSPREVCWSNFDAV